MTDADLRAAAERLRGIEGPTFHGIGGKRHISEQEYADAVTLARGWLAEHRPDDPDAVTEDWLRAVGFVDSPNGSWLWLPAKPNGLARNKADVTLWQVLEMFDAGDDGEEVEIPERTTRGAVRSLCRALGIPLTEPA